MWSGRNSKPSGSTFNYKMWAIGVAPDGSSGTNSGYLSNRPVVPCSTNASAGANCTKTGGYKSSAAIIIFFVNTNACAGCTCCHGSCRSECFRIISLHCSVAEFMNWGGVESMVSAQLVDGGCRAVVLRQGPW
jgi:hypothetical protein